MFFVLRIEEVDGQTTDPDAKFEIEQLKKEFQTQKEQINLRYEQKRNTLKKQKKQEIDNLRNSYKNRFKRLEQKYPDKIKRQEISTQIKRPLPLDKKDSKYLDPRESELNNYNYKTLLTERWLSG